MGVMAPAKPQTTSPAMKRRSGQLDFSSLGPLKTSGTVGFSTFRDKDSQSARRRKGRKSNGGLGGSAMDADSDEDDEESDGAEILSKMEDADTKYDKSKLGPEDAKFTGELADGVNRIRVCLPFSFHTSYPLTLPSSSARTPPTQTTLPAPASHPAPAPPPRPSEPAAARATLPREPPRASLAAAPACPTTAP